MKSWLKGGFVGGLIGVIIFPIYTYVKFQFSELASLGFREAFIIAGAGLALIGLNIYLMVLISLIYYFVIGFIIGSIIGWIMGKIKSKKQV